MPTSKNTTHNIPEPNNGDGQPPRPPNSWILYRRQKLREGAAGEGSTQTNASRLIGQMWKKESKEVKDHYAMLAAEEEKKHKATYPDYVYRPGQKGQRKRKREAGSSGPAKKARTTQGRVGDDTDVSSQWDPMQDLGPSPPLSAAASPELSTIYLSASTTTTPATQVARPYPGAWGPTDNLGPSPPLSAAASPRIASSSLPTVSHFTFSPSWELAALRGDWNALQFEVPSGSADGAPLPNSSRGSLLGQPRHEHNLDCGLGEIIPGLSNFQDHPSNFEISAGEMAWGGLPPGGFDDAFTQYPNGESSSHVDEPLLLETEDYSHFGDDQTRYPDANTAGVSEPLELMTDIPSEGRVDTFEEWLRYIQELEPYFGTAEPTVKASTF